MRPHETTAPPGNSPARDPGLLDDFELITERARVTVLLAALTDRYRQLNHEMNQRKTLQWMLS